MDRTLPSMILTGASGFVGRHLLEAAKEHYRIYAIARRSQKEVDVPAHPNIRWIQVDIANWAALKEVMRRVKEMGGADYVVHLAAFYDFNYEDSPEYVRTNVHGTRHMLEQAKWLCVRRFVFASSLAACEFPPPGGVVTEKNPADASYAYARTKAKGEEMCREYSRWFPCSTVRFAAVFSDWCEYPPLYVFLSTWLSRHWNSRILGGRGESAVSYIHVSDLTRLLLTILSKTTALPSYDVYAASPNGSASHRKLYETATRYFYGRTISPIFMPRVVAGPGVLARDLVGRIVGRRPFERPWMIRYIDRRLNVDSSYTRNALGWKPTPRYHILRRLLFLIEKMKSSPGDWQLKNEAAMKREIDRPNLRIHEALVQLRERHVDQIVDYVRAPERHIEFSHYREMSRSDLRWYISVIYRLLMASVRTGDRALVLEYADDIACRRFQEGFLPSEVNRVLQTMKRIIVPDLVERPELKNYEQEIHDSVVLTVQLGMDEIEDCYERFSADARPLAGFGSKLTPITPPKEHLERIIGQLDAFYEPPEEGGAGNASS